MTGLSENKMDNYFHKRRLLGEYYLGLNYIHGDVSRNSSTGWVSSHLTFSLDGNTASLCEVINTKAQMLQQKNYIDQMIEFLQEYSVALDRAYIEKKEETEYE